MKYLDKVYKVNADGENYTDGYRLELTALELVFIKKALEFSSDHSDEIYKEFRDLLNKFEECDSFNDRGLTFIEAN